MNDRLKSLYKSQILKRSQNPEHFGEMEDATHVLETYNPMCGDQYKLFLYIDNEVVLKASFHGYGCAISKASTEILAKRVVGKKLNELHAEVALFLSIVDSESTVEPEQLTQEDELLAFVGTRQYPEREQCASLSWTEMADFLKEGKGQ